MPKQKRLEGIEDLQGSIPEINRAADTYRDLRDERIELLEKEKEAKKVLAAAMKKHELDEYTYDGFRVYFEVSELETVRVTQMKIKGKEDEDAEE